MGGSAFHSPGSHCQQGQLGIPIFDQWDHTILTEEAPCVRTSLKKFQGRLAEKTYHLMHVMTVIMAPLFAVAVEKKLSLYHFPSLIRSV